MKIFLLAQNATRKAQNAESFENQTLEMMLAVALTDTQKCSLDKGLCPTPELNKGDGYLITSSLTSVSRCSTEQSFLLFFIT